jgi:hypothetical protein
LLSKAGYDLVEAADGERGEWEPMAVATGVNAEASTTKEP